MHEHKVKTIEDTARVARLWIDGVISERDRRKENGITLESAHVTGLSGHLGAGKTAFVQCVARECGIQEDITSPTFVIMKIYPIDPIAVAKRFGRDFPWKRLVHIDAYRLEKREELQALSFEQVVSDSGNLVLIEWPEQVQLEKSYPCISFSLNDSGKERTIRY